MFFQRKSISDYKKVAIRQETILTSPNFNIEY